MSNTHIKDYVCTTCGRIVREYEQRSFVNFYPVLQDKCYECDYWLGVIQCSAPDFYVINNQYFYFPPIIKEDGRVRHILTTEGQLISSTELFNYGYIPERFREYLPNTANFISYGTYRRIQANSGFKCRKFGCWDRMSCLWFNEKVKDWNKIPNTHVVGDEGCPLFINKLNPK